MTQEIGKIEKPEASIFQQKKKLFLVPLLYASHDAPPEYIEKFELYWKQAAEHIENLESKLGKITRVYHESITLGGEDGLKIMEKLNQQSCHIVKQRCQGNAIIEKLEDKELAEESMDWERCLLLGFLSNKVAQKISEFYIEAYKKRYEYMSKIIEETLQPGETAILFIREGHLIQFPGDIEVFSVSPPALDEIHRCLRSQTSKEEKSEEGTQPTT